MQNGLSAFDALVRELSTGERRDMLEKVQSSISVTWEPEGDEELDTTHGYVDAAAEFLRLPFLARLWIMILSFFGKQTREELVQERLVHRHAVELERKAPRYFERRNLVALPGFFTALDKLAEALRPLSGPVSRALGRNEPAFLAFLLGLEIDTVQRELTHETDPFEIAKEDEDMPEPEVRRRMNTNLEYILESMPSDSRNRMYDSARFLHALYRIVNFPFQSISGRSLSSGDDGPGGCPVSEIADALAELSGALNALRYRPSPRLLEAVFIFDEQERIPSGEYNLAEGLPRRLRTASEALKQLRSFMDTVPVADLTRVAYADVNYEAPVGTGGEDWFALVKRFWNERCDKLYAEYVLFVQKRRHTRELERIMNSSPVQPLSNYKDRNGEEGRHARSLGALLMFFRTAYRPTMLVPLKTLLIDGEFYKSENRTEYDEAFEVLEHAEEGIKNFQQRLGESGDLGMTLDQATRQPGNADSGDHVQKAMKKIDERASELLSSFTKALRTIMDIVNGILYGEVGGRYDTLANLGQIGGRGNKALMASLDLSMRSIQAFLQVFDQLVDLERGAGKPR